MCVKHDEFFRRRKFIIKLFKNESVTNVIIKKYEVSKYNSKSCTSCNSGLIKVKVEYDCNGKLFKKFFLIKIPSIRINYAIGLKSGFYLTVKNMYEEILPVIIYKMKSNIVPAFNGCINSEILILENPMENSFQIKHNILLNFEKCKSILEVSAEFHAVSYKLHQENQSLFLKYQRGNFFNDMIIDIVVKRNYTNFTTLLKKDGNSRNSIEKLEKFKNKITHIAVRTNKRATKMNFGSKCLRRFEQQ